MSTNTILSRPLARPYIVGGIQLVTNFGTTPATLTTLPIEICREISNQVPDTNEKHATLRSLAQTCRILRMIFFPLQWARVHAPDPVNPRAWGGLNQRERTVKFCQNLCGRSDIAVHIRNITFNLSGLAKNDRETVSLVVNCLSFLPNVHTLGLVGFDSHISKLLAAALGDSTFPAIRQLSIAPTGGSVVPRFPNLRTLIVPRAPRHVDWEPASWTTHKYVDQEDETYCMIYAPKGLSEMDEVTARTEAVRFPTKPTLADVNVLSTLPLLRAVEIPCNGESIPTAVGFHPAPEHAEMMDALKHILRTSSSPNPTRRLTAYYTVEPVETEWERKHVPWMAVSRKSEVIIVTEMLDQQVESDSEDV